ncbi:MAG: hypothetical protein H0V51_10170 [Chloroflexi bacterium]|nr:hypothetical protein [Chloroflexota bacterium]
MDSLEALFLFCFVFGVAFSGIAFLLGSLHLPGLGHHDDGHGWGGHGHGDAHLGHGGHAASGHSGHGGHGDSHGHGADVARAGGNHGDGGLRGEAAARAGQDGASPFNMNTITAFLAFFGGIGYVLYGTFGVNAAVTLILATLAGLAGGSVVFLFLVKILLAGQRFLDPVESRPEGAIAQVTRSIRADGIGEIIYSRNGARRSDGARSATGAAIPVGTEVVVVRYEKGLAYVEPWESYVEQT